MRIVGRSYILDFLQENKSEVQPETIHADTQGQSTAIFGLAYLLGIELMPRIRNWKDQHLFRPAPDVSYQHIDELFTAQVDWDLIATLAPDMMRVAVSIRTGNILPSDILRRLNSGSRKNKLYFGFREFGPSSPDDFLVALSLRCRAAPHDSSGHQQERKVQSVCAMGVIRRR